MPPFLSKLAIRKANDIIEGLEQLGGEGIPKTPEPAKEKIEQKESIPDTENIPASKPYAVHVITSYSIHYTKLYESKQPKANKH